MAKPVHCTNCDSSFHYQSFCPYKKRKPIRQLGKQGLKWKAFRRSDALPYLTAKYGYICAVYGCYANEDLDVDHIKERGSSPALRYELTNLRFLCRNHHREITDGAILNMKFKELEN